MGTNRIRKRRPRHITTVDKTDDVEWYQISKCFILCAVTRRMHSIIQDVIFRPCGRKIASVWHFCPSLWTDKMPSVGYFPSTEFLVSFTSRLFLCMLHKKTPLLTYKLSVLQLNQATFDLPGSAIIRPTHKPSCRSSRQNSFYKFGKKLLWV